jgi:hypothetical protein
VWPNVVYYAGIEMLGVIEKKTVSIVLLSIPHRYAYDHTVSIVLIRPHIVEVKSSQDLV